MSHTGGNVIVWIVIAIAVATAASGIGYVSTQPDRDVAPQKSVERSISSPDTEARTNEGELATSTTKEGGTEETAKEAEREVVPPAPPPVPQLAPPPIVLPPPLPLPAPEPEPVVERFTIEADDSNAEPDEITVTKGATIELTFKVRTTNVYFGGLLFESSEGEKVSTGDINPGESRTVTFVAEQDRSFIPFWPSSRTRKPYEVRVFVQ